MSSFSSSSNGKSKFLGKGSYGQVHLAKDKLSNKLIAEKIVENNEKNKKEEKALEIISQDKEFCSQRAICLVGTREEKDKIILKMSYISGYSGDKLLKNSSIPKGFQQEENIDFLIDSVSRLHKMNIYHMDIKPSNIMYDEDSKKLRLIDFGGVCLMQTNKRCVDPSFTLLYTHPLVVFLLSYKIPLPRKWCEIQDDYATCIICLMIGMMGDPNVFNPYRKVSNFLNYNFNKNYSKHYSKHFEGFINMMWDVNSYFYQMIEKYPQMKKINKLIKKHGGYIANFTEKFKIGMRLQKYYQPKIILQRLYPYTDNLQGQTQPKHIEKEYPTGEYLVKDNVSPAKNLFGGENSLKNNGTNKPINYSAEIKDLFKDVPLPSSNLTLPSLRELPSLSGEVKNDNLFGSKGKISPIRRKMSNSGEVVNKSLFSNEDELSFIPKAGPSSQGGDNFFSGSLQLSPSPKSGSTSSIRPRKVVDNKKSKSRIQDISSIHKNTQSTNDISRSMNDNIEYFKRMAQHLEGIDFSS